MVLYRLVMLAGVGGNWAPQLALSRTDGVIVSEETDSNTPKVFANPDEAVKWVHDNVVGGYVEFPMSVGIQIAVPATERPRILPGRGFQIPRN